MELYDFAYCSPSAFTYLATIAEPENWKNEDSSSGEVGILFKYIAGTFKQCFNQNKIVYTKDCGNACFNTGLLTPNGNDIIAVFEQNDRSDPQWKLKGFFDITERFFMSLFSETPLIATYTDNYEELYFNPNLPIVLSSDHILDDNWDRIAEVIPLPKPVVKTLLIGVVEETKKRIQRNMRLVVPQFYNDKIMYLMPIDIPVSENDRVTMALAVELTNNNVYRANTILTKAMAYEKARLLMKPESNWLI